MLLFTFTTETGCILCEARAETGCIFCEARAETGCILCEARAETEEMQVVERRPSEMKDFKCLDVDVKRLPESPLIQYSGGRWKMLLKYGESV